MFHSNKWQDIAKRIIDELSFVGLPQIIQTSDYCLFLHFLNLCNRKHYRGAQIRKCFYRKIFPQLI